MSTPAPVPRPWLGKKPPDNVSRLAMFLDLADQYCRLTGRIRVDTPDLDSDWENIEYKDSLMLRAGLLRKFIKPSDQVCIPHVLNALLEHIQEQKSAVDYRLFESIESIRFQFMHALLAFEVEDGAGEKVSSALIFDEIIYGGLLHADYGKWIVLYAKNHWIHTITLVHTVTVLEDVLQRTTKVIREDWDSYD